MKMITLVKKKCMFLDSNHWIMVIVNITRAWNNAMQKTASLQPETPQQTISTSPVTSQPLQ